MPGIVEFPQVVQDALARYGDLFGNQCQRRHFAEYLTGLMVAERKTVLGINREFVETTDQSCLNRFLTDAEWDVEALNRRRLEQLQEDPSTHYSDQGVIPIDNTLFDQDGLLIPDAGWFWDHAEEWNKIAQDYLVADYVCTSGKHYPLEFRLFRKREICEAMGEPFPNHTALYCDLVDWVCERKIPGTFAIDSFPDVKHKVRIVILWRYKKDAEPCKISMTNRITWEVTRIVRAYRHRLTGTETFHRDGKQQLGLGDCQPRDLQGQTRHIYLVMLAYSLLMSQLRQSRAREWALHRLTTIGEACRAMLRENLRATLAWVIEQVKEKVQSFDHVVAQLGLS